MILEKTDQNIKVFTNDQKGCEDCFQVKASGNFCKQHQQLFNRRTGNLLEGEQLAVPHGKIQRVEQKIRFTEVGNLG